MAEILHQGIVSVKSILKGEMTDKDSHCIKVAGWIRSVRNSKTVTFIALNDGSCFESVQVVVDSQHPQYEMISKLTMGSAIVVSGQVVASQGGKQKFEVLLSEIHVTGLAGEGYPLQKKATSLEFLREIAHLRPRTNTFNAVARIRSSLSFAIHEFFNSRGFTQVHTPIISGNDCEGAGELFRVTTHDLTNAAGNKQSLCESDYFGKETFLTVSGQLEAEAYALGLGQVYTFGPTFRSENSNTSRHLAEFWMVEPEMSFTDLKGNAQLASEFIQHLIKVILNKYPEEMAFFEKFYQKGLVSQLRTVSESHVENISYTQAIEILVDAKSNAKTQFEYPVKWGVDLQTEHERFLAEEYFKAPVIVTDYPQDIKAFYMKLNTEQGGNTAPAATVRAMDVLVPGVGEIIGGSQREDNLALLEQRMKDKGLDLDQYQWYLDLRRYGSAPHSGFGMGFERMLMYLTGMSNVRDVIAFPRTPKNCEF